MAISAQTGLGTPAVVSSIQFEKPLGTEPPWVGRTCKAMPSKMDHVARVTINGCKRRRPTSNPLKAPADTPMASITMLHNNVVEALVKCVAARAVPRDRIPPTDRSIPAVSITIPSPRATAASGRVSAQRVPIWSRLMTPGCRAA